MPYPRMKSNDDHRIDKNSFRIQRSRPLHAAGIERDSYGGRSSPSLVTSALSLVIMVLDEDVAFEIISQQESDSDKSRPATDLGLHFHAVIDWSRARRRDQPRG